MTAADARRSLIVLQLIKQAFQRPEFDPCPFEHSLLNVKFFARNEIHFLKSGFQHGPELGFQVVFQLCGPGRQGVTQTADDIVDFSQVNHVLVRFVAEVACGPAGVALKSPCILLRSLGHENDNRDHQAI